jgi:small-conductance mechanosensitive channel/CRP-like cAMP-binding protein
VTIDFSMLHSDTLLGAAFGVLIGLLALSLRPIDRPAIRGMLILLLILLALDLLCLALEPMDFPRVAQALSAIAVLGIGAVVIRLLGILLFRSALAWLGYQPPRIVEDLTTTAAAAAWLLFWLTGAGLDLTGLVATSAVITAVLAFSMQDTLGNILGGVVLQLDDSVRIGEWVTVDGVSGQVVDVRWRHTAIETRDRETVIIPNGWLVKNRFSIVGSRRDASSVSRRWVYFNLELATAPAQVCEVLEDSVRLADIPNVVSEPPPSAVLMEVGQGYGKYALRFWIADPRPDDPTDSSVRLHALAALARHRIALAVTREERLITKENEARQKALRADEVSKRAQALAQVDLFRSLSEDERTALADNMVIAPFIHGDTITRQGAIAHWLYLIAEGEVEIWSEHDGQRTRVATLGSGSVFGEMGLMTGEPRRASVIAKSDAVCLRLDKAGFEAVLRSRPDIAGDISNVIAERMQQLDSAHQAISGRSSETASTSDAIRGRIRRFFGLENGAS